MVAWLIALVLEEFAGDEIDHVAVFGVDHSCYAQGTGGEHDVEDLRVGEFLAGIGCVEFDGGDALLLDYIREFAQDLRCGVGED